MNWNLSVFKVMSLILFSLSSLSVAVLLFLNVKGYFIMFEWELYSFNSLKFVYSVLFDWVSLSFLMVVFVISSMVMFYSHEYMSHEKSKNAFAFIVFLFVMSMMFLIISPNLISVILGWDGLGLVSYLLVVYYQNFKSYSAGMITCLSNRVGDSAILISMGLLLSMGSLDFVFYYSFSNKEMAIAGVFVVLATMTKSAQIPFSAWLPAAMAAPTPVSALVHSSTLVTAGVYLLIRFYPMIMGSEMSSILFIMGSLTMTMSGLGALYEMDLKKIIALSTLSQLGLMMMSLSMGFYLLAFFHLLTHALFKASLFLSAGSVIHFFSGSQDIRYLSVVSSCMPFTCSCLTVCSLSLGGAPFLSAFYSKDKIIEESFSGGYNTLCLFLLFISVLLTMMYSFRLLFYMNMKTYFVISEKIKDSFSMLGPIMILSFGGIVGGSALNWVLLDLTYDNLSSYFKEGILLVFFLGLCLGVSKLNFKVSFVDFYFSMMWFLPTLSSKFFLFSSFFYSKYIFKFWDMGWNEKAGPAGLSLEVKSSSLMSDSFTHVSFKMLMFLSFLLFSVLLFINFY